MCAVIPQAGRRGRRLLNLGGPSRPRYRKARLRVCKDELDNLILCAERGRSVLLGHLAIELDDICHRSPDQVSSVIATGSPFL